MNQDKDFITIKELSLLLGVCTATIKNWEKENKLPFNVYYTIGKHRRFSLKEINNYIENMQKRGDLNE